MKRTLTASLLMGALVLTGCGFQKANNEKEEAREKTYVLEEEPDQELHRMKTSTLTEQVKCGGDSYVLSIERVPDEKLPCISSAMGNFVDNRINVRVERNGKGLVKRSFTRADFLPYVKFKETQQFRLEGLVLDDISTEANKVLTLAASLSYPDSDLYIPFRIVISKEGKVSISLDETPHE